MVQFGMDLVGQAIFMKQFVIG